MNMIHRRTALLSFTFLAPVALLGACSPAQKEAFIDRIKRLSQTVTDTLTKHVGGLLSDLVAQVAENNAKIQAIAPGDVNAALKMVLPAFIKAVQAIMKIVPIPLPPIAVTAINTILNFFAGTVGAASAAAGTGMTVEEAERILRAL
jgi:hypothetical protein